MSDEMPLSPGVLKYVKEAEKFLAQRKDILIRTKEYKFDTLAVHGRVQQALRGKAHDLSRFARAQHDRPPLFAEIPVKSRPGDTLKMVLQEGVHPISIRPGQTVYRNHVPVQHGIYLLEHCQFQVWGAVVERSAYPRVVFPVDHVKPTHVSAMGIRSSRA